MANYIAHEKSGQLWGSKNMLFFSETDEISSEEAVLGCLDSFVENLILERLSFQSPIRVLFEAVPGIRFQDAIKFIKSQPISSDRDAEKRYEPKEKKITEKTRLGIETYVYSITTLHGTTSMHYLSEFLAESAETVRLFMIVTVLTL